MKQIINLGSSVGAHNGDGARTGGQKINDNFTELYMFSEFMGDEIANLEATKLAIANNLSDLDDAATARTNLGIGNIDNTSDANKPVSTAQATADATVLSSANSYTDSKVASVYKLKGSVANYAALPSSGQVVGDVWNLVDTGANYVWTGTVWDELGTTVDISVKANLASPSFNGTPLAPTAPAGTNNTQIATTAFATAVVANKMNNPSLTASYIPKALNATTIGNSQIRNEGNNIQIKNTELFPNTSYDVSLGFDSNKTIAIEDSDNSVIGRSLNINAGRAINFSKSNNFIDVNITGNSTLLAINLNDNSIYSTSGNNIIKSLENSNIFNIVGTIPTGIISDISIDYINNDVWVITAPATTGNPPNIYKQSLGSGVFVLQTFTGLSNINNAGGTISLFVNSITKDLFYVAGTSIGGDGFIYKKSSGNTVFSLYDNTLTCTSYTKIKVNTSNNDILLFYSGTTGSTQYLYKQSLGSGAFNLIFSSAVSAGSTPVLFSFDVSNTNNNIYTISGGKSGNTLSIFKQTGGSGSFISQTFSGTKSVSYNYQFQTSIVIDNKGDVYGSVNNNIIYKQINYAAGTANLQGGTLKLSAGTGKGTGSSKIQLTTGAKTTSGTDMQIETVRMEIDENGLIKATTMPSYTDNTAALAGGLVAGQFYRTSTGILMITY